MMDRAQQALYLMALDPVAETILDDESYGFRQKRSTADAIEAIYKAVAANKDCAEWVLEGDIKAYLDNISHEREELKKMWSIKKGNCTLCGDEVNKTTGWKIHKNDKNKKEIVHPECHRKIHPELLKTVPVETRQR